MKRIFMVVILFTLFIGIDNVFAKEAYYVNSNNVSFSEEEYNFLSNMFWDGSQDLFTKDDYNRFIKSDILNGTINIKEQNEIIPYGTLFEHPDKRLKIATSCNANCFVSVTLTWKKMAVVRGYDVMGAYIENTSLLTSPITTVTDSNDITLRKLNNGFGVSLFLPLSNKEIVVNQTFRVSKGGHVYASYQHAKSLISLENSKKYTLDKSGYGKVFKYSGPAVNIYDQMSGVDIAV